MTFAFLLALATLLCAQTEAEKRRQLADNAELRSSKTCRMFCQFGMNEMEAGNRRQTLIALQHLHLALEASCG